MNRRWSLALVSLIMAPLAQQSSGCRGSDDDAASPTPGTTPGTTPSPSPGTTPGTTPGPTPTPTTTPGTTPAPAQSPRPDDTLEPPSILRMDAHTHPDTRTANGKIIYDTGIALNTTATTNNLGGVISSAFMGNFDELDNGNTMIDVSSRYPYVVPLLWIHPGHGGSAANAETFLRDAQFAGLKFHPVIEELPADSPLLDPYLEMAARYHVPVVIHTTSDEVALPSHVAALADRHPDVEIVMYHAGTGVEHQHAIDVALAHPNCYLETAWVNYADTLDLIESVGSSRVLFGSDASVDGAGHYEHDWSSGVGNGTTDAWLTALGAALPRDAYRDVLVANVVRVFNLVTIHAYAPSKNRVALRFDNGSNGGSHDAFDASSIQLGDPWSMVNEGNGWWRRQVPAWSHVYFQIDADAAGTIYDTDRWEVWVQDGVMLDQPPATSIQVRYDAGLGHALFLRGEGWPLSQSVGEPMEWEGGDLWTLTLSGVTGSLNVRALIDDAAQETGTGHPVNPGESVLITPTF